MKKNYFGLLVGVLSLSANAQIIQIGNDIDGEFFLNRSGTSVSLSADATVMAIGAPYNSGSNTHAGHVRIYKNDGGVWTKIGSDIDGEAAYDESGSSVSLSSDGSIVAIGAYRNDGNGTNAGHVRIYKNDGGVWTQVGSDIDGEAAEDRSGSSVSLSADGSIVAIGAYRNDGNGFNAGHVRIYKNTNGVWTQVGSDIDGELFDESGSSVSLSSDGSIVAIGAKLNDDNGSNAGHVRIYKNDGGVWTQIGSDINGEAAYDESGSSVSLSADGSIVAIGAIGNDGNGTDAGHVRIYKNTNGVWTQVGSDISGEASYNYSGSSVSLSADGSAIAIGTPANDNSNGSNAGHVRIYKNDGGVWTQIGSDINGEAANDKSGSSVSLSADGSAIAIGAPYNENETGHVRVYSITPLVTGISEEKTLNVKIYPNPTFEHVTVQLGDLRKVAISVTNIEGKEIYRNNNVEDHISTFSISECQSGIYFVKVQSQFSHKIIKLVKL